MTCFIVMISLILKCDIYIFSRYTFIKQHTKYLNEYTYINIYNISWYIIHMTKSDLVYTCI